MIISELVNILKERPIDSIAYFAMLVGFFELLVKISAWIQIKAKSAIFAKAVTYILFLLIILLYLVIVDRTYPIL